MVDCDEKLKFLIRENPIVLIERMLENHFPTDISRQISVKLQKQEFQIHTSTIDNFTKLLMQELTVIPSPIIQSEFGVDITRSSSQGDLKFKWKVYKSLCEAASDLLNNDK